MIGAELLLKCLEEKNVDKVFGIPGGVLLPLYDVLPKSNIQHILMRHEQGAAHAADGYARSTGKVGVCFATSGPGATNLLTGLGTAMMDSVPVVAITGQVAQHLIGKDSFQEADTIGFSLSSTKYNYLVKDAEDIPAIVEEAFYIAQTGRPGPVLIDVPKDVLMQIVTKTKKPVVRKHVLKKLATPKININQLNKAFEAIKKSKKPLIIAGGGIVIGRAEKELQEVAQKLRIPVAVTLMGKGSYPSGDDLFLGMVGMHGTVKGNYSIQESDLIIAIGMRFSDRVVGRSDGFAPKAKIIHVDIEAAEIDKNIVTDIPIVADCKEFLTNVDKNIEGPLNTEPWIKEIQGVNKKKPIPEEGIQPENLLQFINEYIDDKTIVVTDVGQHQMWSALYIHPKGEKSFLTSGGLGTMGYGLPAAIGAQVANPDKRVVLITGDGSFQMNLQEMAIVRQYSLPITIVLMNNRCLGMVRQWQELFHESNYSQTLFEFSPDWELLAQAYGIKAAKIEGKEEVDKVFTENYDGREPAFLDYRIDCKANVFPMVPAGCSLDEIWGCK
ncbi:MAG: biosynthetic-type acetolactate synthase large subunit [Clostridia bacterium]|nr:biosynthetic-type acetolactate synthase large subunit [Clostridia bacterium]